MPRSTSFSDRDAAPPPLIRSGVTLVARPVQSIDTRLWSCNAANNALAFDGATEPIAEPVEVVQCYCRVRPGAWQAAAKHAALMVKPVEQVARPGEDRAVRRVEVFPQRDIHRVEQRRRRRRRDPCVGRFQQQPRAIEMQPDPALAGETRDCRQLLRVKRLPCHPPHRRFDRDRADRNATRIPGAPAAAVWISAKLTVARPGASGTGVRPLSVCAQSPSSFHKWLSA